jgi:hypothetical protein
MAKQLSAQVDIDASPERVWQVLTDFPAYPEWNPFMTSASGRPTTGSRLVVHLQPVGGRAFTMRPTVLEATPGRRLRWLGHLGVAGIFDGEHSFTIEPHGDGHTRLAQRERFRGLLVPLLARSLDRHTLPAFDLMNQALKHRAEHATV